MKSKILGIMCLLILGICFVLPQGVWAEDKGSITIYQIDSVNTQNGVAGVKLSAYKIATGSRIKGKGKPTADFKEAFDKKLVSLDSKNLSSSKTVSKLTKYVKNKNLSPEFNAPSTDFSGKTTFYDLPYGVYLIVQTNTSEDFEKLGYTVETESYIVEVPTIDNQSNQIKNIVCKPKCKVSYPEKETISVDVYKDWKDQSNSNGVRPDLITVGLFKDNKNTPEKTAQLSTKNSWHIKWTELDKNSKWRVDELDNLPHYKKTVKKEGTTDLIFTITNTYIEKAKINTGDNNPIIMYISILAGAVIFIIVIYLAKKRRN